MSRKSESLANPDRCRLGQRPLLELLRSSSIRSIDFGMQVVRDTPFTMVITSESFLHPPSSLIKMLFFFQACRRGITLRSDREIGGGLKISKNRRQNVETVEFIRIYIYKIEVSCNSQERVKIENQIIVRRWTNRSFFLKFQRLINFHNVRDSRVIVPVTRKLFIV